MTEPWPYPAPDDDGACDHLVKGLGLPSIQLPATSGSTIDIGKLPGTVVLFIYPYTGREGLADPPGWDDIPGAHGSTQQAEGFRDAFEAFSKRDVKVFGLSNQDSKHQAELAQRLCLPFQILSDARGVFQKEMHLPTFKTGDQSFLKRVTLVIENGRILKTFYPIHPPNTHAHEVLAWLNK